MMKRVKVILANETKEIGETGRGADERGGNHEGEAGVAGVSGHVY